jgi:hypothetical protein
MPTPTARRNASLSERRRGRAGKNVDDVEES